MSQGLRGVLQAAKGCARPDGAKFPRGQEITADEAELPACTIPADL